MPRGWRRHPPEMLRGWRDGRRHPPETAFDKSIDILNCDQTVVRVGGLGGHEPHISDIRTPLFAKLTTEPHTSGSESNISGSQPHTSEI